MTIELRKSAVRLMPGPLLNASALYLFYFMSNGAYSPFINIYYERIGLSGVQIGTLTAIGVLVGVTTGFPWGAFADRFRLHKWILSGALFISPGLILLLSRAPDFASLVPLILLYSLVAAPVVALLDSSVLELVGRYKSSFGAIRLWGSVGWAAATWLVGMIIESADIRWLFYCWMLLCGVTFLFSIFQPARTQVLRSPLRQGLRGLIRRSSVLFLLSILVVATSGSGGNAFYGLFMEHLGAGAGLIGFASSVSALSEVPLMLLSGTLIRRFGSHRLLVLGMALYVLRWLLASLISTPLAAVLLQFVQGFAFAAFLTGGVTYFSEQTPEGMATTAQALYGTVAFGLASIGGSLLGGYLYDYAGIANLFRVSALLALAGLALFLLIPRLAGRQTALTRPAVADRGERTIAT